MNVTEHRLPRDVIREIKDIAHFGHATAVQADVEAAYRAIDEERLDDAVELLDRAKHHAPRSPSIRELLGLVHYHRSAWREAARELAAYRRLSGRFNQEPVYADATRALGRPERAVEILQDVDPAEVSEEVYVEALVVGAGSLRDLGRPDDAVELLRKGPLHPPQVRPHHLRLWYALADALEDCSKLGEARAWWDAIYAEDPSFFDVDRRRLGVKG